MRRDIKPVQMWRDDRSGGPASSDSKNLDARPHAVVIGSGFGGLAASIRLAARGYRVTVFDKLDQPGGRAAVIRQDGFQFDAGPTIITAPFLLEELWGLCGRRMEQDITLKPLEPFYRLMFHDGTALDCSGDTPVMRAAIQRLAPGDLAGYDALMLQSAEIYRIGFEQMGTMPFSHISDIIKVLPAMAKLRADRSLYKHVSRYIKDERLRLALSFHPLFIGGNPFSVTSIYGLVAYLEHKFGVHYVMGGTGALVRGLAQLVEGQGSRLCLNSEVREITVENGRATGVVLADGTRIAAQIVVSNACTAFTYNHLLAKVKKRHWTPAKIARARYSMGVFVWYFGTNRQYPDVPHHTIMLGPRYKGLLDDIFHRKVLAEDFSLYLHRPTASDASVAPPGHDAFYALVPVPNLQGNTDWTQAAEALRQRVEAYLEKAILPGLGAHLVTSHVTTPLDFESRLLSTHGAAFGMEPILLQSAYFRPHNACPDIDGLYFVGAGTHPGAGVPGVLTSAQILDKVVPDAAVFQS